MKCDLYYPLLFDGDPKVQGKLNNQNAIAGKGLRNQVNPSFYR